MFRSLLRIIIPAAALMAIADPATVAAKWASRTQAAATDYAEGVANTTVDPTALAIQAGPRYLQRVTDAFNSGKWANGLRRAGAAGWKEGVRTKGASNFSTGVAAAQATYADKIAPVLAFESTLQSRINSMPNITAADRRARMVAWFDGMSAYGK